MTERKKANELGLQIGKEYIVRRDSGNGKFPIGTKVIFISDDRSTCPEFRNIATDYEGYIWADAVEPYVEVETTSASLKNFIIDVTDVETAIRVGKLLSADQIKRILEILGE